MFEIDNIRLLTADEFRKYKYIIPEIFDEWWLSSHAKDNKVFYVDDDHQLQFQENFRDCGVRPVIEISDFPYNKKAGEKIMLFGCGDKPWTILENPATVGSYTIIIYDGVLGNTPFDYKTTEWNNSNIRKLVEDWAFRDRKVFDDYMDLPF